MDIVILNFINPSNRHLTDTFVLLLFMLLSDKQPIPYAIEFSNFYSLLNKFSNLWPVFRFSDALFRPAESLNEKGRGSEALPCLNRVRTRAGLADITTTGQAALRTIIVKECRIALAFENRRPVNSLLKQNTYY